MKTMTSSLRSTEKLNLIARFGAARLVAKADGRIELRGGSKSDLAEAREWVSLFLHHAVPRVVPAN